MVWFGLLSLLLVSVVVFFQWLWIREPKGVIFQLSTILILTMDILFFLPSFHSTIFHFPSIHPDRTGAEHKCKYKWSIQFTTFPSLSLSLSAFIVSLHKSLCFPLVLLDWNALVCFLVLLHSKLVVLYTVYPAYVHIFCGVSEQGKKHKALSPLVSLF